jgi:ABC-type glycerol-3-phosphate transport system substrate-binding protein
MKSFKFFAMAIVAAAIAAGCGGKEEATYLTSVESVREHLKGEWYHSDGTLASTYLDSTYIHSYEYNNSSFPP